LELKALKNSKIMKSFKLKGHADFLNSSRDAQFGRLYKIILLIPGSLFGYPGVKYFDISIWQQPGATVKNKFLYIYVLFIKEFS